MTVLLVLAILHSPSAEAIGSESHNNQKEEEAECEVCLPRLDYLIEKDDEEPAIGNDGPDGSDSEYTSIRDFLYAFLLALSSKLFSSATIVVFLRHSIDGDARDNQEVEGGRADNSRGTELTRL